MMSSSPLQVSSTRASSLCSPVRAQEGASWAHNLMQVASYSAWLTAYYLPVGGFTAQGMVAVWGRVATLSIPAEVGSYILQGICLPVFTTPSGYK